MAAIEDLNYFEAEEEHIDADIKHRIEKIILKKFLEQRMNSIDQKERDAEITRLVSHQTAAEDMRLLRKRNKELDESKYEQELLNI